MKPATINEIKKKLSLLTHAELVDMCCKLARFKKENKELISYLVFESGDESAYIKSVQEEITADFAEINKRNGLHIVKKSLRKILRNVNRHARYIGTKESVVQLAIHYCAELKHSGIAIHKSPTLTNLYSAQLKKISKALPTLHEDLQFDIQRELDILEMKT